MIKQFNKDVALKVTWINGLATVFDGIGAIEVNGNRCLFLYRQEILPIDRMIFYDEYENEIDFSYDMDEIKEISIVDGNRFY